nr:sigma-70 family RNA polymerase sigma factor [Kineosporia mesophila]
MSRGSAPAFEIFHRRTRKTVIRLARTVLRDWHQAEEVAQEVMLELWRHADGFDPAKGSAEGWITVITRRRAVDRVRSSERSRTREHRTVTGLDLIDDEFEEAVLNRLQSDLDAARLRRCLDQHLSPIQRDTIKLAYFGNHSYARVASLMKLPLGTIKTRIRDGLIHLRNCRACSLGDLSECHD